MRVSNYIPFALLTPRAAEEARQGEGDSEVFRGDEKCTGVGRERQAMMARSLMALLPALRDVDVVSGM